MKIKRGAVMDFPALQEALDSLSQASLAVENRSRLSVQVHLEEARLAAAAAFAADSEEARSLTSVIGAVEAEASAAGLLEAAVCPVTVITGVPARAGAAGDGHWL